MVKFQSTLPREERLWHKCDRVSDSVYFNPRSHERSDCDVCSVDCCKLYISIHAPTRGATVHVPTCHPVPSFQSTLPREERPLWCHIPRRVLYFNPRSHERSDEVRALQIFDDKKFQSTLPREERHSFSAIMFCITKYFNPRSHERSDFKTLLWIRAKLYFNPRSHERSDISNNPYIDKISNFNPRSHERSDGKPRF